MLWQVWKTDKTGDFGQWSAREKDTELYLQEQSNKWGIGIKNRVYVEEGKEDWAQRDCKILKNPKKEMKMVISQLIEQVLP